MPGFTLAVAGATKHHHCTLCRLLLRQPVQTCCGHRCCLSCVKDRRGESNSFICPEDQVEVKEVFPDRFVEREILNLTGSCENSSYGCPWVGLVKDYEEHFLQCEYNTVKCPNKDCGRLIPRAIWKKHVNEDCQYREVPCDFCGELIVAAHTKSHLQIECPQMQIICSNCGKDVLRGQLAAHQEKYCDEGPSPCPFVKIGCAATKKMKKNDKRKHMDDAQNTHMIYLLNLTMDIAQKIREMEGKVLRGETAAYEDNQLKAMKETAESLTKIAVSERERKVVGKVRRDSTPATTEASKDKYSSLPEFRKPFEQKFFIGGAPFHISTEIADLDSRITALSCHFDDVHSDLMNELQKVQRSIDAVRDSIRKVEQKFSNVEDVQQKTAINIADQNDRIEFLETACYNGVLIWAIADFTKKRHDSIVGRNISFYSPYFYTSRYGYKMRLRIYLNGDGIGKGSHISLFFVVCKGNYDALLPWPFRQKVTMSILDQGRVKDVSDSFKPDPSSSSFQRPKKPMNVASGCPLFMPIAFLDTYTYTANDTLYIKAEVETANIPAI